MEVAPQGGQLAVSQLQLSGMHCAACAGIIERALLARAGVVKAEVNAAAQRLALTWLPQHTRLADVLGALPPLGYDALPDLAVSARAARRSEHRQALWRLFVASFLMMQVMMLAAPIYVAEPGDMTPDLERLLVWGQWVLSLPVLVFSAGPFLSAAWRQLRAAQVGMEVPVALGLLITFVASSASTFDPTGPFGHEVYFDSFTMFVTFLLGGRYAALLTRHRVARALELTVDELPQRVQRRAAHDGDWTWVDASDLRAGDVIRVVSGQAFAADGVVIDGQTSADERLMSGESHPVAKVVGDEVLAGSLNLEAPVQVRVTRAGNDTRLRGIEALMQQALTQKPAAQALADRIAQPFLLAVLALALISGCAWWWFQPERAIWVAVSVLVVTCPCALSLAAPSAWLSAVGGLARQGVLIKRLDALEALATVDTLVLDKTGTLTREAMAFEGTWPAQASPDLIARAAALAALSQHPYARALVQAMGQQVPLDSLAAVPAGSLPAPGWRDVQEFPGRGLQARDAAGECWRLGSSAWASEGARADDAAARCEAAGCQVVLVGHVSGRTLGFRWAEQLRPQAREAVLALQAQGLAVRLLSGDAPARVELLAQQAGIGQAQAQGGKSPHQKLDVLTQLQTQGHKVLVVGDGINDAPMLARADVSLAMGHAAMTAQASADGVIVAESLLALVQVRAMAQAVVRVVRRNLVWAAAYNATCIPLAVMGWLPPWAAGLGMALSSAGVVMYSATLLRPARGDGVRGVAPVRH